MRKYSRKSLCGLSKSNNLLRGIVPLNKSNLTSKLSSKSYIYEKHILQTSITDILKAYPKKRITLPIEYKQIYSQHYKRNRRGETNMTSISSKLERWLHKVIAKDVILSGYDPITLEIGAGTLNHLPFEPNISCYDIIEPFHELLENAINQKRIRHHYNDIDDVPLLGQYDRIISIATFEHITDLPKVIAKSGRALKPNGHLRVSIPNEGRSWWKLGTLVTGSEFKRMYGLDYKLLMKHEHVNNAYEIENLLRYFFKNVTERSFGINKYFSFYLFFDCWDPDLSKVESYLKNLEHESQ